MVDKIWIFKNKKLQDDEINSVSLKYRIPRIISAIILNRNIDGEKISSYLKKSISDVINPELMLDMEKAADRILKAVDEKEKITVYGDYDVDGITATALMYQFLSEIGADVEYYIPDRKGEGYGINIMAVNKLARQGTKLMITVDCGITAIGEVEFAKLQGMDIIITDHHTCKERIPESAVAILNPKRPDCEYPFESLAGVGVAFKLILELAKKKDMSTKDVFARYIDLVTLGTIADVVPLLDENRIIVDKGIKSLQNPHRPGIKALFDVAGIAGKPVNVSTVAFAIAPRLNAAGRLGTATTAVELLLTKEPEKARQTAVILDEENKERQKTEHTIFDEALEMIAKDPNFEKKKVIVLAHEGWHNGVIGIVASRLCDMYYKPCILISHSNGIGKGSGRSIKNFNLFDALTACDKYLTEFGGHAVAAGLNINISDLEDFEKAINKYADEILTDKDMIPSVEIDCPISEKSITLETAKMLSYLEPFGMGNERPVFALAKAQVVNFAPVGNDNKHLKLRISKNGFMINCIGFGLGDYASVLNNGSIINIAFHININSYQGNENVQLVLKDIKIV